MLQEKVLALIECAVRWKKEMPLVMEGPQTAMTWSWKTGDATGDGGTTDSDDVELVKGDVTGDGGTTDSNDIGLVAGGVGDDSADTNACEEAAGVRVCVKGGDSDVLKLLKFSISFIHLYTNLSGL